MLEQIGMYLAGLPTFLTYLAIGGILMLSYIIVYNLLTPLDEWRLIQQSEPAAAVAFSGSLLGFVVPLSTAIKNAQSNLECVLWGIVVLIVQVLVFFAVRLFLPKLSERICQGDMSAGMLLGVVSLSAGILVSASMTF